MPTSLYLHLAIWYANLEFEPQQSWWDAWSHARAFTSGMAQKQKNRMETGVTFCGIAWYSELHDAL